MYSTQKSEQNTYMSVGHLPCLGPHTHINNHQTSWLVGQQRDHNAIISELSTQPFTSTYKG